MAITYHFYNEGSIDYYFKYYNIRASVYNIYQIIKGCVWQIPCAWWSPYIACSCKAIARESFLVTENYSLPKVLWHIWVLEGILNPFLLVSVGEQGLQCWSPPMHPYAVMSVADGLETALQIKGIANRRSTGEWTGTDFSCNSLHKNQNNYIIFSIYTVDVMNYGR